MAAIERIMRALLGLRISAVITLLSFTTVVGCPLLLGLAAQSKSAPVIGAIHSSGQERFSEGQVISTSGLQVGQVFEVSAIQAATQKLVQSGAFEEVQFKYRPENGQMAVEFVIKEATRFHRCTYDNLVWASAKEINDFVRNEVPLFDGFAPEGGDLPDDIARSLERFLKKRGIGGRVEHVQFGRGIGDRHWEHLYSVNGPVEKVEKVLFEGVHEIDDGLLQKEAKSLVGRNYSFVEFRRFAEAAFVPIYRERGFLRVDLGNPVAQLSRQVQGSNEIAIQVTYAVAEGVAYDWEEAKWSGNQAETSAELDGLLGMKQNERANGKKLDAGWEAIRVAYGKKGYLEARLKPEPRYDEAVRRVGFQVTVTEGPQFRMGTFSMQGVPLAIAERIKQNWKLKSGDIYDASYISEFLKMQLAPVLSFSGGRVPKIQTNALPDQSAHTVDVSIQVQ